MALTPDENPSVRELIAEEGFERLAQAIHQATVQAQYWQEQKEPNAYEVCYGLAQRWKRAVERHEFVNELMDFVRAYNEENLKKKERRQKGKQYCRQDVLQSDLQTVLGYMDTRLSAATISLLLLAFGYAMTEDEKKRIEIARVAAAERRSAGVQAGQNAS